MPNDHTCSLCGMVFDDIKKLIKHVIVHTKPNHTNPDHTNPPPPRLYRYPDLPPEQSKNPPPPAVPVPFGGDTLLWQYQHPRVPFRFGTYEDGSLGWLPNLGSSEQIGQENRFGVTTTTHTQSSEHPNGDSFAVSTVTSSLGSAIVTTAQSTVPPITTTRVTVSQASGTISSTTTNASCPGPEQAYNNECPICLKIFKDDEKTITAPCNHRYHNECISGLADAHANGVREYFNCAICREEILYKWLYK